MKNKGLYLGLLTFLLLALVSCGKTKSKRDHLIFNVWGDNNELASYEAIADAYELETGMKVEVVSTPGDYYDNLNISFSSKKNAPDIFFTESGEFISHLASSKILNLEPYIKSGALEINNGKIELWDVNSAYQYDGKEVGKGDHYALIKDWSPDFIMWYNKSHIDEYNEKHNLSEGMDGFMEYPKEDVPLTWDEFLDMSHKLKQENRYGTMLDRVPYKHLMEFIQMTGSSTWDSEQKLFNSSDPNVLKAFKFFTDLQIGNLASAPIIGPSGVGSGEAFANGNISFAFFGNWAYSAYNWGNVGFEIGYAPSPVPDKGRPLTKDDIYAGSCGMIALGVYKDSSLKDEAVNFLNFYMTYGNSYMAKKGFNIPGNKKIANSKLYTEHENFEIMAINQYFLDIANNYTHPIIYNKYLNQETFEDILGKHMSTYLANPKGETLSNVLKKISDDVKREM